jgi:2-keto-4-pentenoate hydratase
MPCGTPVPPALSGAVPADCLARALAWADRHRRPLPRPAAALTDEVQAYRVQREFVSERSARLGEPVRAFKVSMTSPETQALAGGRRPAYGRLTAGQILRSPAQVSLGALLAPRLELELQFLVREDLSPEAGPEEIVARCDVAPGLEVPDSRFRDWFGNLSALEVIADNAVAGLVVVGRPRPAWSVDVGGIEGELRLDGRVVARGLARAVMGSPVAAIGWLARELARTGETLAAGTVVSSGTFALPVALEAGEYVGAFGSVGEVRLVVTP